MHVSLEHPARGAPVTKTLALVALLAAPVLTLADDHFAREVQERFGVPSSRDVVECGTSASGASLQCVRWGYDAGDGHAVFYFEQGTDRLLEVFTWDASHREATNASDQVRRLLDSSRKAAEF
jgi:hypothetical protein